MGAVRSPHDGTRFARAAAGTPKSTIVRRALVALLLASALVVVAELPAHACKCVTGIETAVQDADAVFTGMVVATTGARRPTYDVEVDRVFKGDIDTATVQVKDTAGGTSCALDQQPLGETYAFFVSAAGDTFVAEACTGATRSTDRVVDRLERILGEGRDPVPPAPPEATITVVASEHTSVQRLAAPGVALVLVGLLGLVLVGALGRRRA
jgi:hypothetical protein